MNTWGGQRRRPDSRDLLDELERQEARVRAQTAPERPEVTREALADAWRAVGAADEVQAGATALRYWWRRWLRDRARHAAPEL